jgi:4-hydroxy-2-oxoheptanedioate aldolase
MRPPFKQKLARSERVIVVNADHPSPSLVEKMGRLPIDAVFIDCEQGSPDVESVENMARAARLGKLTSLVRLFDHRDWVIERYMGRGVDGIVVPRLESAEQAISVVATVRYCFPDSYRDKIIVAQIETRRALETLDEFLSVDGIDVLFLGPVDLAKSLGFSGDFRCPEMQRVLRDAVARIDRGGGVPGILVDRDSAARWVRAGARFLYEHADSFLALGAENFVASIDGVKAGDGAHE